MTTNFLLFDLDGVLIRPIGYRKAVLDSIDYFLMEWGFQSKIIDENIISTFESVGITSEWDMVPLTILCVIEYQLTKATGKHSIKNRKELTDLLDSVDKEIDTDFLIRKVKELGLCLEKEVSPSESIYKEIFSKKNPSIFPAIFTKSNWLFDEWIKNTRNINKSKFLQLFQNLTLGSQLYKKITLLDPILETNSYLIKHDEKLINQENLEIIKKLEKKINIYPVVITARPSGSCFSTNDNSEHLYYPEAELAMKLLDLEGLPFIGYGALDAYGRKLYKNGDSFVKPSAFHALSSILYSTGFSVSNSFDLAFDYLYKNEKATVVNFFRKLDNPIHVTIFEDSIIGIQSVKAVCESLTRDGIEITFNAYGITENREKKIALEKENAIIFPTINEAFSNCVEEDI